jgi:Sap-like sulfolipid-1-addressing protein
MGDALAGMLPYAVGLLVSPVPIVAAILLLVSRGGTAKAAAFEATWLVASFAVVVGLARVAALLPRPHGGHAAAWERAATIAAGVALVAAAGVEALRLRRGSAGATPRWMTAVDDVTPAKAVGVALALLLANPLNAGMLLGASLELSRGRPHAVTAGLAAVVFVLAASLAVLAPYAVALVAGPGSPLLHRARRWLIAHNGLLSCALLLAFGAVFLVKGLR